MMHSKLFYVLGLLGVTLNPPRAASQAKFIVEIGHSSPIWAVAISPDNRTVATAGSDGARLWDGNGKELRQFGKQTDESKVVSPVELDSVAFSQNGKFVLTAGRGSPARLWDAATGNLIRAFGTSGDVYSAGFSPDGRFVMTGTADGTIQLWDTSSGHEIQRFATRPEGALQLGVLSLALSADGRFLLSALGIPHTWFQDRLNDSAARLWDVGSGREVQRLVGHASGILSVTFLRDGKFALTAGSDKTVRLWDVASGKEVRRFAIDGPNEVESAAFSRDGRLVVTASRGSESALVWDTGTGQRVQQFEGHKGRIWSTEFSTDGSLVVTGSEDHTARLWRLSDGQELRRFEGQTTGVSSGKLSHDGRYLISTRPYGTAQLWDISSGRQIRQFEGLLPIEQNTAGSVAFSPDGKFLLTGSGSHPYTDPLKQFENVARLWDTASGQEVRRLKGHSAGVWAVAFSPDGKFALTGSGNIPYGYPSNSPDNTARLWEVATGIEIMQFRGHSSGVESVSFSPNAEFVLTGGADNTVRVWKTATGQEIKKFEDASCPCAFSTDGKWIVAGGNGTVRLWDAASWRNFHDLTGNLLIRVNQDGTFALGGSGKQGDGIIEGKWLKFAVFSPDSRSLLTDSGFGSKSVMLWDLANGRLIKRFESLREVVDPHVLVNRISSAAFSHDGRLVMAGGTDGTVRLWDVARGHEIANFERSTSPITSVGFSPDRRYLFATSEDGRVRIWNAADVTETSVSPALTMVSFRDGGWALADSDGRFDSDRLEQIKAFHWVFPDDPFRALPPEIFMRDYYEPRLLPRLLAGEPMPKVRPLQDLNRVQPEVKIVSVNRGERPDVAEVWVEVSSAEGQFQRDGKAITMKTDAYDLRLFRAGELVGQTPEPLGDLEHSLKNGVALINEELESWRNARRVKSAAQGGRTARRFTVRLPHGLAGREIEFTAYAFNEDRVKSETARVKYRVPQEVGPVDKRAYVVAIGVNAYDNPESNLQFAAGDAKRLQDALAKRLSGYKVVPVTLVSDCQKEGCPKQGIQVMGENHATKAALHAVLEKLAGHELSADLKKSLPPGGEKIQKAEPDDLVVISVSSHGYTSKEGMFYVVPSDSGKTRGLRVSDELLKKWVSSDELSAWLRDVDSGDLVMIVDTCHSAATVEEPGFKPGPMGSRGLGQLAYDKGMRILAASQADDVALESENLKQGLLTYALVENGLEERQAVGPDGKGEITLDSWLQYGVDRVPTLYQEVRVGKVQNFGVTKKETVIYEELSNGSSSLRKPNVFQQPSFFNFRNYRSNIRFAP